MPTALIAGIGNIFLGDDGFGPAAVRELMYRQLPGGVKLVDYGIRGIDLALEMLGPYKTIVLIDAIARGEKPGTVYVLQPAENDKVNPPGFDAHSMHPANVLAIARFFGKITAEVFIVGCEPEDFGDVLEGRMSLSATVAAAVPRAAEAALECLSGLYDQLHQMQSY
jgi:hydrogenase maturation protease